MRISRRTRPDYVTKDGPCGQPAYIVSYHAYIKQRKSRFFDIPRAGHAFACAKLDALSCKYFWSLMTMQPDLRSPSPPQPALLRQRTLASISGSQ